MIAELSEFHFLRPLWLLALIPACLLIAYFWRQKSSAANWRGAINETLLCHLIEGGGGQVRRWPWLVLLLAWLLSAVSLSGPTWQKLPQPVLQKQDALVIVLDLSLSMLVEDVKPSRLVRARHKILDILAQREEGLTGLIAYSGDAHIVSPLTDDTGTIANLTPALSPTIMPVFGSAPADAIEQALQLFSNSSMTQGRILLITDAISETDLDAIDDTIKRAGFELSIMGIGTEDGAPIPRQASPSQEGFLKDNNGNIVVPKLPRAELEALARRNDGRYTDATLNDKDINFLLAESPTELNSNTRLTEREFDQWHDRGPWLAMLLLPLSLLAFRRGWLLLLPLFILIEPQAAHALSWQDLWQRADQQAADTLAEGNAAEAAEQFKHPEWKASAQYRAGDFEAAAKNFAEFDSANAHYNRGNALAKAGKLDQAIEAYQQALQQQPEMEDAQANKALVEQLKQQQEQQSQQSDQSEQSENQSDQSQSSQQEASGSPSDQEQSNQRQSDQNQADSQQSAQNDSEQNPTPQNQPQEQQPAQQNSDQRQASENTEPKASEQEPAEASQKEQDLADNQSAQAESREGEQQDGSEQRAQAQAEELNPEEQQRQQAMEQWLRKIPDDPAGLLRRKFDYEYRLRQQQGKQNREQPLW